MNFKKLLSTKVHITRVRKKHVQNAISVFLIFCCSLYFGQVQKLDSRFETLLNNKENVSKGMKGKDLENLEKQLDSHLVVTAKGAQTMYSCIIYTKSPERLKSEGILVQSVLPTFVTALVSVEDIEKLLQLPYVTSIMGPSFDKLHNDVSRAQSGASLLQNGVLNNTSYNGSGILVGVYDTGIDWKHPDFRKINDQTKSRIYSIWDQTLTAQGSETPPTGFNTGVEYTRTQIEDEIDGTPANVVRETDTNGHGTHVAGTAAGNGAAFSDQRHKGFATDADIVIVKGGNGSFSSNNTIDALTYFKNVATALNRPIVVNMSIGGQASGHDGLAAQEVAVDSFTASGPGRVVVISAGNDYGKNIHRNVDIASNATGSYVFTVGSDTSKPSVFAFIMFANNSTPVTVKLTTPDGQQYTQNVSTNTSHSIQGGAFTATMYNYWHVDNNKRFVQLIVTRNTGATADCQGTYTLEITNDGADQISTNGWLYDQAVTTTLQNGNNDYIVGTPGNATSAVTVAAYAGRSTYLNGITNYYYWTNDTAEGIASFSSQGPRIDGVLKPEIAASGEFVISSMSSNAPIASNPQDAGNVDGTYYRVDSGTSMASPGVAGSVALLLQANPNLTAAAVKDKLTTNTRKDAATGNVPNPRWGNGKLDIYKAVASEVGCPVSEFESINYDTQFYQQSSAGNYYFDNFIFAVRYTPTRIGKLGGVSFMTSTPETSDVPFTIDIRKVDAAGNPGDLIASKTFTSIKNTFYRNGWNYINLSDLNVNITTKEDFYVVLDTRNGRMGLWRENTAGNGRSKYSTNGTTWSTSTAGNFRIRAVVYEDKPGVKRLATANGSQTSTITAGKNYYINNCELLTRVEKETASTISGNVTSKVWVDAAQPNYVSRRYEINPVTDALTATGKVTLYFNQADFDAYNLTSNTKLPTSNTDDANKANILIEKYAGTSAGNTGTIASFGSPATMVPLNASDIVWNDTYKYWEISFQNTGFGGYFLKASSSSSLGTAERKLNSEVNLTPNPAKDVVNVILGSYAKAAVSIYDASGKFIKTANVSKNSAKIDVSELIKGVYLFTITLNDNTVVTKKVIKE
nr:S8/S53 family peptidase [uncultured Chryseobacterium sp.]